MTKLEASIQEYRQWCKAIGIECIEDLNAVLEKGYGTALVNICEARQERKYAEVADQIFFRRKTARIVMLSGPSSSGKTSSSLRIAQQCAVLGMKPKVIELDNYFVNREDNPLDENGVPDYECLGAMNVDLLNSNLCDLLEGKEVLIPRFDFVTGHSEFDKTRTMKLDSSDVLFMEGIHALNPALVPSIDHNRIFGIYISPLSALDGGEKFHGSTTDKRLLRRILRDNRTRGNSPEQTILRWPSVRKGEIRNIYPYEDNAEVVFNSSMIYDMPLLKHYAEPLLQSIDRSSGAFEKASALLDYTGRFRALTQDDISAVPVTSIMREFIGGQRFI